MTKIRTLTIEDQARVEEILCCLKMLGMKTMTAAFHVEMLHHLNIGKMREFSKEELVKYFLERGGQLKVLKINNDLVFYDPPHYKPSVSNSKENFTNNQKQ